MATSNAADTVHNVDFLRWDGIQRYLHPLSAPFSEPTLMVNFTSNIRQAKRRRSGYTSWLNNPDANPIIALVPITRADGTGYVLRFSGKNIYKWTVGSGATNWGSPIYTFTNTPSSIDVVQFYGLVYICSGTNDLLYYDAVGGTFTTLASGAGGAGSLLMSKPTYCEVFGERLVLANMYDSGASKQNGYTILFSKFKDGTSWVYNQADPQTAQSVDIDADHKGFINDLSVINNRLCIFKTSLTGESAMYRYAAVGDTEILTVPTDYSIRPGGMPTMASIDGITYFTNADGIYEYAGDRPVIKSLALGDIGKSMSPKAGVAFDRKYWCSLSAAIQIDDRTITNPIVVFDRVANEVYFHSTADYMTAWAVFATANTAATSLYSGDTAGQAYVWGSTYTTDNGVPIHAELETRYFFGKSYNNYMNFINIWAYANPAGLMKLSTKCIGQLSWDREVEMTDYITRLELPNEASRTYGIAFRLTSDTAGTAPVFYGFSVKYEENVAR